jgi:hypothetical protein
MVAEQIYRYPRWMRWPIELLCGIIVLVASTLAARDVLRYLWVRYGLESAMFDDVPFLPEAVAALGGGVTQRQVYKLPDLLPSLGWFALALLLTLLLRNSLPTVRTSARGILVEFAGDWLPIPWESFKAIKVTEDLSAERFVLLAETDRSHLTGWHWFYSLLYGFSFRPGFLIISAISNFDGLIKTLLSETDRVARVLQNVKPARLQEEASSPLFRFLLGPASFLSRRDKHELVDEDRLRPVPGGPIPGFYPMRIKALFIWGTTLLAIIMLVRYAIYWLEFAVIVNPGLLNYPVFSWLQVPSARVAAPWWSLVAAHLMVIFTLSILIVLRHLLPELEARSEGLAVRYFNSWYIVPWSRITTVKVTEFSEDSQVVLVKTNGGLPASSRVNSLLYDSSLSTGVLITSALDTFEPLLQRVVQEVARYQSQPIFEAVTADGPKVQQRLQSDGGKSAVFQDQAYSPLLFTAFRAGSALDRQVEEIQEDEESKESNARRIIRSAGPMFWLALPTALLAFFDQAIQQGVLPDGRLIAGMILLFILSFLEWPLVAICTLVLDEMSGGGEEGYRPFYLYPITQLPRLLLLVAALVAVLLGIPGLPVLLWLGAIVWSFLLAAGLWEALYGWKGGPLFAGGLLPVVFQLLVLLAYLLALR